MKSFLLFYKNYHFSKVSTMKSTACKAEGIVLVFIFMTTCKPILLFLSLALPVGCGNGGREQEDSDVSLDPADTVPDESIGPDGLDGLPDPDAEAPDVPDETDDLPEDVTADETAGPCPRLPGPDDRPRMVVVSRPYDAGGNPSSLYEVLVLSEDGELSTTEHTFELVRANIGLIAFTPDGEVGIAVSEDDGTLGAFKLDGSGSPEVTAVSFDPGGYASSVVMDPSGERVYALSSQWEVHGGGIYSVAIECDGTLTAEGQVAPSQLPYTLTFLPGSPLRAVTAAGTILASAAGHDAHLLLWGMPPSYVGGADAFADDEQIVSTAAATPDGRFVLIGDNGMFSDPNRVAVVEVLEDGLRYVQTLAPLEDPMAIVVSPFENAALAVSGFGNAIFAIGYDPDNASAPFTLGLEIAYAGNRPALPAGAVMVERGSLRGRVLIAENVSVRQVQFNSDGTITDLGAEDMGSGTENMVGAIGMQP
jgi:hypothetical protein